MGASDEDLRRALLVAFAEGMDVSVKPEQVAFLLRTPAVEKASLEDLKRAIEHLRDTYQGARFPRPAVWLEALDATRAYGSAERNDDEERALALLARGRCPVDVVGMAPLSLRVARAAVEEERRRGGTALSSVLPERWGTSLAYLEARLAELEAGPRAPVRVIEAAAREAFD